VVFQLLLPLDAITKRTAPMSLSPETADTLFDEIAQSFERGEREKAISLAVASLEQ
jgi:hypothetical protein